MTAPKRRDEADADRSALVTAMPRTAEEAVTMEGAGRAMRFLFFRGS